MIHNKFTIHVERLINPGQTPLEGVRIEVQDGIICRVEDGKVAARGDVKIAGSTCSPALFNAHDHLKYTWGQRLAAGNYENSYEWLPNLYYEAERRFLNCVSAEDLYWLGTYKSILSGVTTVANHCRPLPPTFLSQFPIRILHGFRREIFVRDDQRAHRMGQGVAQEARLAKQEGVPFVVHVSEGIDSKTAQEIDLLDALGGLFEGSVLIHAINISNRQIEKIAASGASVVWCPTSNQFLFSRTCPIYFLLKSGVNVALGTDSTCTGAEDLFHEMRVALKELEQSVSDVPELVHSMATVNGVRAFGQNNLGRVESGCVADLLVFESLSANPFEDLLTTDPGRIMVVLREGRFLLRRQNISIPSGCFLPIKSQIEIQGLEFEIVGDPEGLLARIVKSTGRPRETFPLGVIISPTANEAFL